MIKLPKWLVIPLFAAHTGLQYCLTLYTVKNYLPEDVLQGAAIPTGLEATQDLALRF